MVKGGIGFLDNTGPRVDGVAKVTRPFTSGWWGALRLATREKLFVIEE